MRERVGVLDLPGFTKFEVSGPGAEAFLDMLTYTRLPQPGRISLAYVLTERGQILSEFTIARIVFPMRSIFVSGNDCRMARSGRPSEQLAVRRLGSDRKSI